MTAVEQLIDQLTSVGVLEIPQGSNVVTYIIEQALEMEENQIKDAWDNGCTYVQENSKKYYNETFKTK